MTPKYFIAGLLATAVAFTAISVSAREGGPMGHKRPSFSELDADKSGEITLEELTAHGRERMKEVDANSDGLLSRDELIAHERRQSEKRVDFMLSRFDANGDGALSEDEMPRRMPERMFEQADADGSGGLSEEEFAQMGPHGKPRQHKP